MDLVHTGGTVWGSGINLGKWNVATGRKLLGYVLKGIMSRATQCLPLPPLPHDLSSFAPPHVSTVTTPPHQA